MSSPERPLSPAAKRPNPAAQWLMVKGVGLHTLLYKRGIGRKMGSAVPILVTVTGRKSGKRITVPLGTLREGDSYVVIGSVGGADYDPQWWLNMLANPEVLVQDGDKVTRGHVDWVSDPAERADLWRKVVTAMPNYAGYEKKTSRIIPLGRIRTLQ